VDERASRFQPQERRIANYLASEGHAVVAVHDGYGRQGRKPDAAVDGVLTEFKSLDPGASNKTVKAALGSAEGQARHAVVDGRGSGLDRAEAERGLRRFLGTAHGDSVAAIRVIGDDFDLNWKRG
jgi:Contact-dependent growth inhibition CdiA C-terminal domain